jgi:arabinofuranosyltransferase
VSLLDGPASRRALVCSLFVAVFVLFAANFVYFFVDDEAIPFIYARNVLEGEGLVYNPDDGPVEAYSDFLSVWIDSAILGVVTLLGGGKLTALAMAKLASFGYAIALVIVAFSILTVRRDASSPPVLAGMTFVTLAGPLALWAWSGLETTLFALLVGLLVATLLEIESNERSRDRLMLAVIVLMMLSRIDGFVWAGALTLPFLVAAGAERQRVLLRRVIVPAVAMFVLYHAWRVWYFGEPLPMPLYAKVLYKLGARGTLIANEPPSNYLIAFFSQGHWLPAVILALGLAGVYRRSRELFALAIGILLLTGYLSLVGDWMFGFRFFVALIVPLAVLAAAGFDRINTWSPRAATVGLMLWTAVVGHAAFRFERTYEHAQQRASWLREPSVDPARFFAPYYQIYLLARAEIQPGETLAYNQAGLVPFLLDARNIDDLGICTKFYAKLPTTDVIFTEVGRYSPLLPSRAERASDMYTAARAPRLLLAPGGNIRAANGGRVPAEVLGGRYRLRFSTDTVAAYVPTGEPTAIDASQFLENLAHVSHLRRASLNGSSVPPNQYRAALPFLYERAARLQFRGQYLATFRFADVDEEVFRWSVGGMRSGGALSLELRLHDAAGRMVHRQSVDLPAGIWRDIDLAVPEGSHAAELSLVITPDDPDVQDLELVDVRVQGQSERLKRFLREFDLPRGAHRRPSSDAHSPAWMKPAQ